ncbi:MAG: toxin-antitoxin system HicB family antitoxin [Erythrobacter sp.]
MSEASFASLGPTLLARKGGAKPAMRPQLAPLPEMVAEEQLEDLGWNDMGAEDGESAQIVSINHSAKNVVLNEAANEAGVEDAEQTLIKSKPVTKKRGLAKKDAKKSKTKAKAKPITERHARRAAFTLRLDTDRHLKLRLAATMQGISAQALVTQALDATFAEIDDLDLLTSRMKRT